MECGNGGTEGELVLLSRRLVAVNQQVESVPWPLGQAATFYAGATCCITLDLLQGLHKPMDEKENCWVTCCRAGGQWLSASPAMLSRHTRGPLRAHFKR